MSKALSKSLGLSSFLGLSRYEKRGQAGGQGGEKGGRG